MRHWIWSINRGVILAVAICAAGGMESWGFEITMPEAVEFALQNNLELRTKRGELLQADAERVRARRIPNPSLQYELVSGKGKKTSSGTVNPPPILGKRPKIAHIPVEPGKVARFTTVELSQRVEIGFQRGLRKSIAETNIERVRAEIKDAERALEGEVRGAFLDVVDLVKKAALADTAVVINDRLVEIAESRFRAGEAPELEVKLARMEAMRARNRRAEVLKHLTVAKIELNRLLGRSPTESLIPVGEPEFWPGPLDLSQLIEHALENRKDLESLELGVEKAEEELTLARRERLPDLHISFVYEELAGTELFGGAATLSIPILDRNQAQVAASTARGRRVRTQLMYRQELIRKEVTAAFERLKASKHRLSVFEEGILKLAEDNLRLMRTAYHLGEIDIFGMIRAQERFLEVRSQRLDAMHDFSDALVELETAVGAYVRDLSPGAVSAKE